MQAEGYQGVTSYIIGCSSRALNAEHCACPAANHPAACSAAGGLRAAGCRLSIHIHCLRDVQLLLTLVLQGVAGNGGKGIIHIEVLL